MKTALISEQFYRVVSRIPKGKVTTYGLLAKATKLKSPRTAGMLLGKNPYAPKVPCHRVVRTDGTLGGYNGGINKKIKLLKREGIDIERNRVKNLKSKIYKF